MYVLKKINNDFNQFPDSKNWKWNLNKEQDNQTIYCVSYHLKISFWCTMGFEPMTFLMYWSTISCNRPLCQVHIDAPRFELELTVYQTVVQNQLHHASKKSSIRGSNPWHSDWKSETLPTELILHKALRRIELRLLGWKPTLLTTGG